MPALPEHLSPLLRADAYPHAVADIRLIETHISWVLLTGELAYKLKRPVHYPFVDLRTAPRRAFLCDEEVRLNRRFAPQLYLGTVDITAGPRGARIGGDGAPIERAVCLRQFELEEELDRLIDSGGVAAAELAAFGRELAAIHATLPRVPDGSPAGTFAGVCAQLRANLAEYRQGPRGVDAAPLLDAVAASVEDGLRALEPVIGARRAAHVRECHGDLHARNVVRWQRRLVAFDCLEFEPALRWIDVADEIAFLWMDLGARRRPDLAQAFLGGYLEHSGDYGLCRLLRLYAVHRALVRAKVGALAAPDASAPDYLEFARELLTPAPPRLLLMSGLSGSGKTWLARRLAPLLGAVHVRSDVERKRLAGLDTEADSHSAVAAGLYSAEASARVYEHLASCADAVLAGALPVIVDATFGGRAERARFRQLAARHGCELRLVHCQAPLPVLQARITRRQCAPDASEANLEVLAWQRAQAEPIGADERLPVIDADTSDPDVVARVRAALAS